MRRIAVVIAVAAMAGCTVKVSPELADHYESRKLHTCCNMFYRGSDVTDVNYRDGEIIPLGTPVEVKGLGVDAITFVAAGKQIRHRHIYGKEQESYKEYFDKILVEADRSEMVARFPKIIQRAIEDGRVEEGMKRGEVVLSLGFPPTDDNPSPEANEWTYWYSPGSSYRVRFDANGYVSGVLGVPAPTMGKPVRVYRTQAADYGVTDY